MFLKSSHMIYVLSTVEWVGNYSHHFSEHSSRTAFLQKCWPIWLPHCPTCTITEDILCLSVHIITTTLEDTKSYCSRNTQARRGRLSSVVNNRHPMEAAILKVPGWITCETYGRREELPVSIMNGFGMTRVISVSVDSCGPCFGIKA